MEARCLPLAPPGNSLPSSSQLSGPEADLYGWYPPPIALCSSDGGSPSRGLEGGESEVRVPTARLLPRRAAISPRDGAVSLGLHVESSPLQAP